uniref:Uncharacterized protein n=1 Tax=viral metagenome TaxID=1070528 RepID=A0A6H1ZS81_9ZZZZ
MTLLSSADLVQIKKDIRAIIEDTSIDTLIKYRQYTGLDYYSPQDQQFGSPFTDWSGVSAIKGLVTRDDVQKVGGGVEIGDTKFVLMQSSVSNLVSPKSDVIVESGVTYNLKKITLDPLGIAYVVYGSSV